MEGFSLANLLFFFLSTFQVIIKNHTCINTDRIYRVECQKKFFLYKHTTKSFKQGSVPFFESRTARIVEDRAGIPSSQTPHSSVCQLWQLLAILLQMVALQFSLGFGENCTTNREHSPEKI